MEQWWCTHPQVISCALSHLICFKLNLDCNIQLSCQKKGKKKRRRSCCLPFFFFFAETPPTSSSSFIQNNSPRSAFIPLPPPSLMTSALSWPIRHFPLPFWISLAQPSLFQQFNWGFISNKKRSLLGWAEKINGGTSNMLFRTDCAWTYKINRQFLSEEVSLKCQPLGHTSLSPLLDMASA